MNTFMAEKLLEALERSGKNTEKKLGFLIVHHAEKIVKKTEDKKKK